VEDNPTALEDWHRRRDTQAADEKVRAVAEREFHEQLENAKREAKRRFGDCGAVKWTREGSRFWCEVGIEERRLIRVFKRPYTRFVRYGAGDSWKSAFADAATRREM
jgi:hypothetical protein